MTLSNTLSLFVILMCLLAETSVVVAEIQADCTIGVDDCGTFDEFTFECEGMGGHDPICTDEICSCFFDESGDSDTEENEGGDGGPSDIKNVEGEGCDDGGNRRRGVLKIFLENAARDGCGGDAPPDQRPSLAPGSP